MRDHAGGMPTYLSLADAAEVVGQSVKTIRRRIATGALPAYRFGPRNIRVRLEDLEATARLIPNARVSQDSAKPARSDAPKLHAGSTGVRC